MLGLLQWWYQRGWRLFLAKLNNRLKDAADFFSIRLLVTNMFAPFRQISVGESASPSFGARIAAFFDRLLSRLIGTIVRLFLLIIGTITIILQAVLGFAAVVFWPFAPFAIVVCIILAIAGVTF